MCVCVCVGRRHVPLCVCVWRVYDVNVGGGEGGRLEILKPGRDLWRGNGCSTMGEGASG